MNYEFPHIESIDDVLPHIKGRDEFRVTDKGDYTVINYMINFEETFKWNEDDALGCAIRRECRGLAFDTEGEIISRPYHKFFNVNEKEETQIDKIDLTHSHIVLEKLDGCLYGESPIEFCDGSTHTISEIVHNKLSGPIWGLDETTQTVVPTQIVNWANYGYEDLENWRKITTTARDRNRTITATTNHKIMTQNGWVEVKDLRVGDNMSLIIDILNPIQKSMILGSLLGDSSMTNDSNGITFSSSHSDKQKEYLDLKSKILTPFYIYTDIVKSGYGSLMNRIKFSNTECLESIAECTYSGEKVVTESWLNDLTPISLAFWYMDDGSISYGNKEKQRPRAILHTEGFSLESKNNIINYFSKVYNISSVLQKDSRGYVSIRFNADDAEKFWGIVAPYMHRSMEYKLPENMRLKNYYWDEYYPETKISKSTKEISISNIETKISWTGYKKSKKYDIETKTNNFFTNGMLVHNSMIRTIPLNGEFRLGTRAGITDVSENAEEFIADKPQYTTFINECAKKGATPLFEWCSRKNRIVIDYPEDQLILTGIRYQWSGTYFQYNIMVNYANARNIPVIKAIAGGEKNLQNIVDHIRTWHDSEGVIIRFNYDGHMLKIKADDYCLKHSTKDSISFEKNVIQVILNDGVDDLIPLLTENDAQRLLDFQKAFWLSIDEVALDIHGMYMEGYKIESQKDFATQFITKYPQKYAPFLYGMRKGNGLHNMLKESIGKSLSTQTKVDEVRWMFGDIRWNT
jgi:hypothetical protein